MNSKKISWATMMPVMFGFFIMGFVDIIGMAVNHVKEDFALSDSTVNLISMSCYLWFLVLSIPTGMLMNKIGRKSTVLVSFLCHVVAMIIPLIGYSFPMMLLAFTMVGIGNTILQVAMNPLVTDVVAGDKLTGTLTLGQFLKAVCSFLGPVIVSWATGLAFGWKLIFPIYAVLSLLALLWLYFTRISERRVEVAQVSFRPTFELFKDNVILLYFIGILVLVGVDVGMNMTFPKFLQERCDLPLNQADLGNSVYFFARTVGAFAGGVLMLRFSERIFYVASVVVAMVGLVMLMMGQNLAFILVCVAIFGLGYANLLSIIFSLSMQRVPEKANEVSALLVAGICGGAVIPPVLGFVTDSVGTQVAAIALLAVVWLYMFYLITRVPRRAK